MNSTLLHPGSSAKAARLNRATLVGLLTVTCLLLVQSARAAAQLTEPFDYNVADGTALGSNGSWANSGGSGGADSSFAIRDGNLSDTFTPAPASPTVTYSKKLQMAVANGHALKPVGATYNSGSVYLSFLFHVSTLPAADNYYAGTVYLQNGATTSTSTGTGYNQVRAPVVVYCQRTDSSHYRLGVRKNYGSASSGTTSYAATTFTTADTAFVVAKYTFNPSSGDDTVALWLNPASLGGAEDGSPAVAATTSGNSSDANQISYVGIRSGSSGNAGGGYEVDNIRIGTAWADVAPSSGPTPPPRIPYVTQTLMTPAGLALRGTNGPDNGPYVVLCASNLAAPRSQWWPVATNSFSSTGTFDYTNPQSTGASRGFYWLYVGASAPPVPVAPVITNQPQSQTVAAGQNATFSVVAGGSAPLSYQWHFNTNTLLTGANNATLILANVQSNNAGGYSVVVANVAGSVTSAVATLAVTNVPPSILTQPQDRTLFAGQSATFSVTATGTAPINYQWYYNTNTPRAAATNASLTLNNVQTNDAGGYSVAVGNSVGTVTSAVARLVVNPAPAGASYYVATNGSDSNPGTLDQPWRTIQKAANTLAPADTVFVRGGVYNEAVTFHVSGSATGGNVTFQNYPGETAIVDGTGLTVPPSDYAAGLFQFTNGGFVTIQGFEIRNYQTNSSSLVPAGIGITKAAHDILLISNRVHDIVNSDANGNAYGIEVHGTLAGQPISNLVVMGNELFNLKTGWSESMVLNGNVTNFEVCSNIIHDNYNIGIDFIGYEGTCPDTNFDRARHGSCHDNIIWNCSTFSNPAYKQYSCAGIYVDGGTDIVIERNRTFLNDIGIELAAEHKSKATSFVTCRDNLIWSNSMGGIFIGGYSSGVGRTEFCTMTHNTLYHNDTLQWGQGEWLLQFDTRSNTFTHNILVVANWENNWLIGNTFTQNTNNLVDWNLYYTPGGVNNAKWQWKKTNYSSFAAYKSATGNDANSVFADPIFFNAALADFHLMTNSPAINAGDPAFEPGAGETDIDGQPRVMGGRTDIGADEVSAGP